MDYYGSMKSTRCVLAGLALAVATPAALSQTPAPPQSPASAASAAPPAQSAMNARLLYELLLGELTFREGDAQNAAARMLNAARRTGDESLFKRATEMAIQSRSGPAALDATRAGFVLDTTQPERRLSFSVFHLLSALCFPLSFLCMVLTPEHRSLAELLTGQELMRRPSRMR